MKSARTTDKATAQRIANQYEAEAALRRERVIDPMLDATSKESLRSIESHLADYEAKLLTAARSEQYVRETIRYIRLISQAAGFAIVGDITAEGVNSFASTLLRQDKSSRTVQAYLTAIKGFSKWLATNRKVARDPLASVVKPNPRTDRRRERRILLPEEWEWLRSTTITGPDRYGASGNARVLLYATAIQTGLRSNELRSLTHGQLFLDAEQPFITCKAGSTKNKKDARQYIKSGLAAELRKHIATKAPKTRVFSMPHEANVAKMIRDDLADARRKWVQSAEQDSQGQQKREMSDFLVTVNHEGEVFDFHSLRHTCGAWLAVSGAHPKEVQTVMRHSSITLTMDTYGHLFPGQEARAVAALPDMFTDQSETHRATGTEHAAAQPPTSEVQRQTQRTRRESAQSDAMASDGQDREGVCGTESQVETLARTYDDVRADASACSIVGPLGFEPRLTDSESVVLPLH